MAHFKCYFGSSKKIVRVGPPLAKLSGSTHEKHGRIQKILSGTNLPQLKHIFWVLKRTASCNEMTLLGTQNICLSLCSNVLLNWTSIICMLRPNKRAKESPAHTARLLISLFASNLSKYIHQVILDLYGKSTPEAINNGKVHKNFYRKH